MTISVKPERSLPVHFKMSVNEGADEVVLYTQDASDPQMERMLSLWRSTVPQGRFLIEPVTNLTAAAFAALPMESEGLVPGAVLRTKSSTR